MPEQNVPVNPLTAYTAEVVRIRRENAPSFERMKQRLERIYASLRLIFELSSLPVWNKLIDKTESRQQLWNEILLLAKPQRDVVSHAISDGSFASAYERATREYVNIGAVGITREGKSTFIRKASSLSEWLIPTRGGDNPCTTASINIINGPLVDRKGQKFTSIARVHYYAVPEMVAYINQYIKELGGKDEYLLGAEITTRKQFISECKILSAKIAGDENFADNNIEHRKTFQKYLDKVDSYADRLLEYIYDEDGNIMRDEDGFPCTTSQEYTDYPIGDIEKEGETAKKYYSSVSYYDSPLGTVELYCSFATKYAEVAKSFNIGNSPVENIQFLDTPGIGESKAGIERTLSDAIAMKLDAVIVVKAVGYSKSGADNNSFYSILRKRLSSKKTTDKWLYFALNVFQGNIQKGDIEKAQNNVKESLSIKQSSSSISIRDDHFRYMDLKLDKQLDIKGDLMPTQGAYVSNYIESILQNLVPDIKDIDAEFFSEGLSEYHNIDKSWRDLLKKIEALLECLPSFETSKQVEQKIEGLGLKLLNHPYWGTFLEDSIDPNLDSFKNARLGEFVLKSLCVIDDCMTFEDLSFEKVLKPFCEKHKEVLYRSFNGSNYDHNRSFTDYTATKEQLFKVLVEAVECLIVEDKAEEKLQEHITYLKNAFIEDGCFGFIPSEGANWWKDAAEYLRRQHICPRIAERFSKIAELSINLKEALAGSIRSSISKSLKNDDFSNAVFSTYIQALCSFIRSLLLIENIAKAEIEKDIFNEAIETHQSNIILALDDVANICNNQGNIRNQETRNELRAFYNLHLAEVLKGEDVAEKAYVSKWREIIQMHNV